MLLVAHHFNDLSFLQRRHPAADHRLAGYSKLEKLLSAAWQQRKLQRLQVPHISQVVLSNLLYSMLSSNAFIVLVKQEVKTIKLTCKTTSSLKN